MLINIVIGIAVVLAAFILIVALQPADFRVVRRAKITAARETVFGHVNDFHLWPEWSPWAKLDPTMQETHAGAPSGTGAIYSWQGNNKVGAGRMTILESRPPELVRIKLEFLKPFAATNTAEFTFGSANGRTEVEWAMFGKKNFFSKAFGLFVSMDKFIGADFEKGLARLKTIAEAPATTAPGTRTA